MQTLLRFDIIQYHFYTFRAGHSPPAVPKELKGFLVECVTY